MSNNIVNQYSSTIISIYQSVIHTYENNIDIIKQAEEELNDLNHECELSSPKDMYKGYLMYKQIREVRQRRRVAKNENEILKDMYDFFKNQQGQNFKSTIQKIQGNAAKVSDMQNTRIYRSRQRNDLTITNQTCEAIKPFETLLKEFNETKITKQNGKLRK